MTSETNGAITPDDAVAYAARILQDQLNVFVNSKIRARKSRRKSSPISPSTGLPQEVDELELSVRSANCLKTTTRL